MKNLNLVRINRLRIIRISCVAFCSVMFYCTVANAQSVYPGQHNGKVQSPVKGTVKAYAFDLKEVRLLDSPFKEAMKRESDWILSLGTDRLLHSFRTSAGVDAGLEGGYSSVKKLGGWESLDCELRGHTTGHILSGLAYLYASTGDEAYQLKSDSLIKGLAEVQNTLLKNGKKGYLSAYPENLIDRNIAGQRVWAPWYTLHKIYSGIKQKPSSFMVVDREWKDGDRIEINYPMTLQVAEANDNPEKFAITYGPLVLAGAMGTEGMEAPAPFSNPHLHNDYYTYDYKVPAGLKTGLKLDKNKLNRYIRPSDSEKLVFYVSDDNIRLEPIHRIHRQRYVVYWDLME